MLFRSFRGRWLRLKDELYIDVLTERVATDCGRSYDLNDGYLSLKTCAGSLPKGSERAEGYAEGGEAIDS